MNSQEWTLSRSVPELKVVRAQFCCYSMRLGSRASPVGYQSLMTVLSHALRSHEMGGFDGTCSITLGCGYPGQVRSVILLHVLSGLSITVSSIKSCLFCRALWVIFQVENLHWFIDTLLEHMFKKSLLKVGD